MYLTLVILLISTTSSQSYDQYLRKTVDYHAGMVNKIKDLIGVGKMYVYSRHPLNTIVDYKIISVVNHIVYMNRTVCVLWVPNYITDIGDDKFLESSRYFLHVDQFGVYVR